MKLLYFDVQFTEICFKGSRIGLNNGFALNRWQVSTWTNDDLIYWGIYASLGLNELIVLTFYDPFHE